MLTPIIALPAAGTVTPRPGGPPSPVGSKPSAFVVRLCSTPVRCAVDHRTHRRSLHPRTDLDMMLQRLGERQRAAELRSQRVRAERIEAEIAKDDTAFQSYSVCALLVEAARYQMERGSTSLNAHIHRVSKLGPGGSGHVVPASTLRVIMNDCSIIQRQSGFPKVVQALNKLPLWRLSNANTSPADRKPQ